MVLNWIWIEGRLRGHHWHHMGFLKRIGLFDLKNILCSKLPLELKKASNKKRSAFSASLVCMFPASILGFVPGSCLIRWKCCIYCRFPKGNCITEWAAYYQKGWVNVVMNHLQNWMKHSLQQSFLCNLLEVGRSIIEQHHFMEEGMMRIRAHNYTLAICQVMSVATIHYKTFLWTPLWQISHTQTYSTVKLGTFKKCNVIWNT